MESADMGECWDWGGAPDAYGYGRLRFEGKTRKAHRVAYEMAEGPIPDGMTVDHLCLNKMCVRVEHLEIVTFAENTRRSWLTRTRAEFCMRGHPRSGENLRVTPNGSRQCRECQRESYGKR
jgi:hypothetical protein